MSAVIKSDKLSRSELPKMSASANDNEWKVMGLMSVALSWYTAVAFNLHLEFEVFFLSRLLFCIVYCGPRRELPIRGAIWVAGGTTLGQVLQEHHRHTAVYWEMPTHSASVAHLRLFILKSVGHDWLQTVSLLSEVTISTIQSSQSLWQN